MSAPFGSANADRELLALRCGAQSAVILSPFLRLVLSRERAPRS
jgi:hypothetical protein